MIRTVLYFLLFSIVGTGCNSKDDQSEEYFNPRSNHLYETIVKLDSSLFYAYNTCDTAALLNFFYEDVEFYHNQIGLIVSKDYLRDAFLQHDCGKVKRERVDASIEVYPIPNFGAIETGSHRFYNQNEAKQKPPLGKFVFIWRNQKGNWKLYRVINLLRN